MNNDQPKSHYGLSAPTLSELVGQFPLNQKEILDSINHILTTYQDVEGGLMVILNEIQNQVGFISQPIQEYISYKLNIPVSKIAGVVSFYSFFTTQPRGDHTIKFCMGTACYVGGTSQLIHKAEQLLNIETGETTEDNRITLEVCRCVGSCSQAPVVVVDEQLYGRLRPSKIPPLIRDILKSYEDS
jgi:NADH:ubiquinone oxidoreductase subunit E